MGDFLLELAINGKSNPPFWGACLGCGQIQAEIGDAAKGVGAEGRGRQAKLRDRVLGPAARLPERLLAAETPRQIEVEVGNRDLERPSDRHQLVGGNVLQATLDLGDVGGRHGGSFGDFGERLAK